MLQNDYLFAKIGVDTAENEPRKECCVVALRDFARQPPGAVVPPFGAAWYAMLITR